MVTVEMNEALLMPILDPEIKAAVFEMGGSKAPGLDGFQGTFY